MTSSRSLARPTALATAAVLVLCALCLAAPARAAGTQAPILVSYLSDTAVYLNAGKSRGVVRGARYQVIRDGEPIAELQVDFAADHSASCTVVSVREEIEQGDEVQPLDLQAAATVEAAPAPKASTAQPAAREPATARTATPSAETEAPAAPEAAPPAPSAGAARNSPAPNRIPVQPWAKASGTFSLGYQQIATIGAPTSGSDQTTARLSLRLREIGGRPYSFIARLRTRERQTSRGADRSDRLSEFALRYDNPESRLSWQVGRMRAGSIGSVGYIDGALAELRLGESFFVGGFAGATPILESLAFESRGPKYGGFMGFSSKDAASGRVTEAVLAGVGEYENGEVSREYLTLQSRFGNGTRWTVYQRAEIDIHRGWRKELAGSASQLSSLSLLGSYRFTDGIRTTLSYNRNQRYRTAETRFVPPEFFSDAVQESYRLTAYFGHGRGWNASTAISLRNAGTDEPSAYTYTVSLYNPNLGGKSFLLGLDASAFTSASADGYLVTLRGRKYFKSGHDLGLALGSTITDLIGVMDIPAMQRKTEYARLSGTIRLPWRLYILSEIEYDFSDDLEGYRWFVNLGYRF